MTEVTIQACSLKTVPAPPKAGNPGAIATDCDNNNGNSAGLYLSPETDAAGNTTSLHPVAIHQGGREQVGDFKDWDFNTNSAFGILLDEGFNSNLVSR